MKLTIGRHKGLSPLMRWETKTGHVIERRLTPGGRAKWFVLDALSRPVCLPDSVGRNEDHIARWLKTQSRNDEA